MATRRGSEKSAILLDWFNVSYRTIFTTAFVILLVLGAGSYYAYLKFFYEGSPKAEARLAIDQAEEALDKAGPSAQPDATTELKQAAQRLLSDARRQYDASNYQDSRKAAMESKLNSEKALAISRGESAREVQFYRIEGDVKVKRVRELIWVDAERGMSLSAGDQVKTSSRASAQIIYFNGTITTIKPGSLLEIKALYDNQATRVQQVRERLREGRVSASTQDVAAKGSYHEVSTQNTVATSADRSEFEVTYDKEQEKTEVEVHSGKTSLAAGSAAAVTLSASERVNVDRQSHVSGVEKVPSAPSLSVPADQKIFLTKEGLAPTVELGWDPVEGATGYRLQIATQPLFAEPVVDLNSLKTTAATLPNVKEGGYYWRVAALFAAGSPSPYSEARKFKVISGRVAQMGDTTPPLLTIDDFLVFASQVIIRGKTEAGVLLTVGGNKVDVYDDGTFTTVVALKHEGVNRVLFVAQDIAGNETRVERTATVDSY
ncbi:MAG TPA: FecR domain-containing protein [Patescibacteria group bacterium]|nr:FecR domain-containing protein [Patescibacteria group bacterium]